MASITTKEKAVSLGEIITKHETEILDDWLKEMSSATRRSDLMKESELRSQCSHFLRLLEREAQSSGKEFPSSAWDEMRQMLAEISKSRALQGFSGSETAMFVLSVKKPLFARIRDEFTGDTDGFAAAFWSVTELLDSMGLYTTDAFLKSREEVIRRQQEEMLELSTPVVKLWEGILALPIIGTLDSARTQVVMETLLQSIVETNSRVAIIDITGVPTVDTVVAQHLLKTVTAARLMGAECIISGVRPQIAQTIVHLGINLLDVTTKATLSDAFGLALRRAGLHVESSAEAA